MFGNKEGNRKEKRRIFYFLVIYFFRRRRIFCLVCKKKGNQKTNICILLLYPRKCKIWMKVMGKYVKLVHK